MDDILIFIFYTSKTLPARPRLRYRKVGSGNETAKQRKRCRKRGDWLFEDSTAVHTATMETPNTDSRCHSPLPLRLLGTRHASVVLGEFTRSEIKVSKVRVLLSGILEIRSCLHARTLQGIEVRLDSALLTFQHVSELPRLLP